MLTKLIIEEIVNSVKCNVNCDSFNPYFVNTVKSPMTKLNICKFNIYLCIVVLFLLIMPIFDIDWDTLSTTESHSIFFFQKIRCVTFSVQETTEAEWKLYSIFAYSVCLIAVCLFDVSVDKVYYVSVLTNFIIKEIVIVSNIISLLIELPICQCWQSLLNKSLSIVSIVSWIQVV